MKTAIDAAPRRVSALALVALTGALAAPAGAGTGVPLEPVDKAALHAAENNYAVNQKDMQVDCPFPRRDHIAEAVIGVGPWGSWADCPSFCQPDSFVYAVQLKSEPNQGGGPVRRNDDTALNGIRLHCWDRFTGIYTGFITSTEQVWGNWLGRVDCPAASTATPIVSGQLQVEGPQGGGSREDDTAANDMRAWCSDGSLLQPASYTGWGAWQAAGGCPAGTAVCGMRTQVEANQGGGNNDDTALNGVTFICCTF